MKCVVTRNLPGGETRLNQGFDGVEVKAGGSALSPAELREAVRDADVVICTLSDRMSADSLAGASRLKLVITHSVGIDHVDRAYLQSRGIKLVSTPGILTDATADLAMALLLACARRLKPGARFLETGRFPTLGLTDLLGLELSGATLGIVGMGRIGQATASRAKAFGMRVVFFGGRSDDPRDRAVLLDELLVSSDVVSLHCPLTDSTRRLIGSDELERMKPHAILVNTARGQVVDEAALIRHLQNHPDFYAGLDVFEAEPRVPEALLQLPNAYCLPHLGSATEKTRLGMAAICIDEALRFSRGERLQFEQVWREGK